MTLPLIVIGSIFLILANPPVNPELVDKETANIFMKFLLSWKEFAVANYDAITTPFNMTMGLLGVLTAFAIAYSLSKHYKLNPSMGGLIATVVYFMICAPAKEGNIPTSFLGADGLFVAIIIALLSVEISRFIENKNLKFKLPESVPPAVATFMNSMLALLLNIILLYGANILIIANFGMNIPEAVMTGLRPGLSVVDNLWGYLAIITFGNILWILGVNGTSIIFPIVFSMGIANTGINTELVAQGLEPTNLMNLQMFRVAILGGAGNTLGLCILMAMSKSQQLKSVGRLSAVPGICGINEPVIFGGPIVFNPILAIPFIITPIVTVTLAYFAQALGFITPGHMVDPSFTPFFVQAYLSSMDIMNVVFYIGLVAVSAVIYYPFFKIYEKNILKNEMEINNANVA